MQCIYFIILIIHRIKIFLHACQYHKSSDLSSFFFFLLPSQSPAPQGELVQCTITRDKSGMDKMHPVYFLKLERKDQPEARSVMGAWFAIVG